MTSSGNALYKQIARALWARKSPPPWPLEEAEALIFDIDGVLVDVSGSFRRVIHLAVQFYFNRIMGVPGVEPLISPEETLLFKLAGRYNNDWDLVCGAAAFYLKKLVTLAPGRRPSVQVLRAEEPSLEQFTAEVKDSGGGLERTLALIKESLKPAAYRKFESLYNPDLVVRIFREHYAGEGLCRAFYGFEPEYFHGPGLIEQEYYLVDLPLLENLSRSGVSLGILSGRTAEEAEYMLRKAEIAPLLAPGAVVVDDGAVPTKPDPAGLVRLAAGMDFASAVYVGDTPDDWTTVTAYRRIQGAGARISGCLVGNGALEGRMRAFFESAGVDYLASDVNGLLRHLAGLVRRA